MDFDPLFVLAAIAALFGTAWALGRMADARNNSASQGFEVIAVSDSDQDCFEPLMCSETDRVAETEKQQRGFEANTTPGMTPGPFEKKEDNHG